MPSKVLKLDFLQWIFRVYLRHQQTKTLQNQDKQKKWIVHKSIQYLYWTKWRKKWWNDSSHSMIVFSSVGSNIIFPLKIKHILTVASYVWQFCPKECFSRFSATVTTDQYDRSRVQGQPGLRVRGGQMKMKIKTLKYFHLGILHYHAIDTW